MHTSNVEKSELRVAIIGAGNICQSAHIPALLRIGASIVSITDPNDQALRAVQPLVPSVKLLRSVGCEIADQANCAIVSSPPALHAEQVSHLLKSGIHVLCEKPLACTFADANRLRNQALTSGLVLQVGYFRRFQPNVQVVYHILRNQELGNPLKCIINAGHSFNSPPASLMNKRLSGGGVLMDFGVHVFDGLLSWLDRVDVDEYADDFSGGLEANSLIAARGWVNQRSLPIQIRLSRTAELGYQSTFEFENASVSCPYNGGHTIRLKAPEDPRGDFTVRRLVGELKVGPDRDYISYFCRQFLEFSARIGGAGEVFSNLADAVLVNSLVDQCYERRDHLKV